MALVKPYTPPREVITLPDHMSYSSLSSYAECGERWRLERGHHYASGTWWATLAGSAIHKATELIDRKVWDGAELVEAELDIPPFAEMFGEEIRKAQDKGEEIKASGRKLKVESENGGPNKKDRDWWYRWGPEFISRWVTFRACHPTWNVATVPDKNGVASPGIELRLDIDMGGQKVLGFIDRVFECDDEYMVFDLKGLDVATPLATPTGWTTMGDIAVGDQVFGANGVPATVTHKSQEKHIGTYRVIFNDGREQICDSEHIWWGYTSACSDSGEPRPMSIDEVIEVTNRGRAYHVYVPMTKPLELPNADLPVDPYVLGCWLGDGKHTSGEIGKEDALFDILEADGNALGKRQVYPGRSLVTHTVLGLYPRLRELGVAPDKYVPAAYLRGSHVQRLRLLQGLMDTDGTWNKKRQEAVFTNCNEQLVDSVRELAISLGCRATKQEVQRTGFGKTVTCWDCHFTPVGFNPFRLPRKAYGPDHMTKNMATSSRRCIKRVEPGPDITTQCIAVDSPDHTYLCGEGMIPTHNTGAVPPGALQLATYGWGLQQVFGLRSQWGYFWTPTKDKEGTLSDPIDIRGFSYDRITTMYQMARQGIEAGIFLPHITNMCAGCGVRDACWAFHSNPVDPGSPLRSEVEVGKTGEDNRMLTERQNIIDMAKNAEDK